MDTLKTMLRMAEDAARHPYDLDAASVAALADLLGEAGPDERRLLLEHLLRDRQALRRVQTDFPLNAQTAATVTRRQERRISRREMLQSRVALADLFEGQMLESLWRSLGRDVEEGRWYAVRARVLDSADEPMTRSVRLGAEMTVTPLDGGDIRTGGA